MAKRKKRVVITFQGREPDNPLAWLEAVENAFHQRDVEVVVDTDSSNEPTRVPNEQLETKGNEVASKSLNKRAQNPGDPPDRQTSKMKILAWVQKQCGRGWQIATKLSPIAFYIKNIFQ